MTLTDSEWRTIVNLIREAQRTRHSESIMDQPLEFPELERAAEAAYLMRVNVETRERRATERETSSPIHPADLPPGSASAPEGK